jgi:hypothetical protein
LFGLLREIKATAPKNILFLKVIITLASWPRWPAYLPQWMVEGKVLLFNFLSGLLLEVGPEQDVLVTEFVDRHAGLGPGTNFTNQLLP